MASWHDARRRLFFESRLPERDFYVYRDPFNDGLDEVLVSKTRVNVRPGLSVPIEELNLGHLKPRPSRCGFDLDDVGDERGAALAAFEMHRDVLQPQYICIAQQRVQPGNDPEHARPLPRPQRSAAHLGRGVKIAVVDTGVANQNGARDVWTTPGQDPPELVDSDYDPLYDPRIGKKKLLAWAAGHGTFIASLIRQAAPGAEIIPVKACSPMGYETEDAVAEGIENAIDRGAQIINLSWCSYALVAARDGSGSPTEYYEPVRLRQAVEKAVERDIVVVAAAGNSASPDKMYPGAWDDVVAVAALDRDGERWEHSNYGSWVDASALGHKLRGVFVRGSENPANDPDGRAEVWDDPKINYATWTGTSFAAPLVAAQIAIAKAAMSWRSTMHEAKDAVLAMSRPATDEGCGKRVLVDLPGQV